MHPFIRTKEANCKDCYKCIRHCSVKAIRITNGHAQIVPERCILDGKCVQICPQNAKVIVSQLDEVKQLVKSDKTVVLSLAPSFPSVFNKYAPFQLYRAFQKLGFNEIEETAVAAHYVAKEYQKLVLKNDFLISSDCPSVVNLIEIYHPHLIKYLAPVTSPMVAHSIMLRKAFKEKYNKDISIVFVGPCIAKMQEAERDNSAADYVISFLEIQQWLKEENIDVESFDATPIKSKYTDNAARMYPLEGGLLKSIGLEHFSSQYFSVTGFADCNNFLKNYDSLSGNIKLAELMICDDGCVSGPLSGNEYPPLVRKKIFEYEALYDHLPVLFDYDNIEFDLSQSFSDRHVDSPNYTEENIQAVLNKTGKFTKEDELNCGACGYYSCRDKAIAVLEGMAEIDMCIPFMRRKAESRTNKIVELDPNGVLEVDKNYNIIHLNKALCNMFEIANSINITGKHYQEIIDIDIFEHHKNPEKAFCAKSEKLDKYYEILTLDLQEDEIYVAIITDITQKIKNKKNIDNLKKETIDKATDVIHKQMRVAQEIASLLGETTAETKVTLLELMNVYKKEVD
ncbi:MAG: 4Fe-4S binding protein [Candidatus Cloacimonetes bacterium]|nr:4Fe-4S binding protein [Candidatus Cloacimonadota bacterium]